MKTVEKGFSPNFSKTQIIEVQKDELGNLTVDARKLHNKLKIKTKFTMWIERRIEEYCFEEGLDYFCFPNLGSKNGSGGHNRLDYSLTTIMAQELCILDNSEIGKAIRLYLLKMLNEKNNPLSVLDGLPFLMVNGFKLYSYRMLQRLLNYSIKSSISNVRRKYGSQLFILERTAYVSEEYASLMIARANARDKANMVVSLPAVVTNQLSIF